LKLWKSSGTKKIKVECLSFKNYHLPVSIAIVVLLLTSFNNMDNLPKTGFWSMKGTLITHDFEDKTDSLSGPEIYELQDSTGLTIWFGRVIFKDVCISGKCKMIRVWIFWNGAGNYLGHQIISGEPLTKSDHTLFVDADYVKLDNILKDSTSILKRLKQEELIIVPENRELLQVDGYTAATQPTLAEVVVKDAVYTCHTLWHTVYGPVQEKIFEILESRISSDYLALLFENESPDYNLLAIGFVQKYLDFHQQFYTEIIRCIQSENDNLASKALEYFHSEFLKDETIQYQIVNVIPFVSAQRKNDILWRLSEVGKINDESILHMLEMVEKKQIGVGSINLVLRLIQPEQISNNHEISIQMQYLAKSENAYVRNLVNKHLSKIN
jgi:hypothetical protein